MSTRRSALLLTGLLAAAVLAPRPTIAEAPAIDASPGLRLELSQLLGDQADAWNRGDLAAFTAVYADDASFLSPSGVTRGRREVLERYRKRYPDRAAMGELTLEVIEVRPLGFCGAGRDGEVCAASAAARWSLHYPEGSGHEDASGLTLLVFLRQTAGWRIVQDASL